MIELAHAPAVRTQRKSRWNPSLVEQAINQAIITSRGTPRTMAVIHEGEVIGLVRGDKTGEYSTFKPITHRQWCGFPTYEYLNNQARAGKDVKAVFFKDCTNGPWQTSWSDTWPCQGMPGSGDYSGTANTLRQFDNTTPGSIWCRQTTPAASETRHIAAWSATTTGSGINNSLILYDRVATYDSCSITTALTTLTNTLAATRYIGAGQEGLLCTATEQTVTAIGTTAATLSSMTVTDQNGNTGVSITPGYTLNWTIANTIAATTTQTAAVIIPYYASPINGAPFPWIPLAANVSGVRKIEAFTSSAINTGPVCWILLHPMATIWTQSGMVMQHELARATFALERVYDNACLSVLVHTSGSGAAESILGYVRMVHG